MNTDPNLTCYEGFNVKALDKAVPAMVTDDLGMAEYRKPVDYIVATGYASRVYPLASPLIRLYLTLDASSVETAKRIAYEMTVKEARRQGIRLKVRELVWVANHALQYVVDKQCPQCHGLKYELIPGTRTLGDKVCHYCRGDGRRKLPTQHRKLLAAMVARIERVESTLDSIVKSRL